MESSDIKIDLHKGLPIKRLIYRFTDQSLSSMARKKEIK